MGNRVVMGFLFVRKDQTHNSNNTFPDGDIKRFVFVADAML